MSAWRQRGNVANWREAVYLRTKSPIAKTPTKVSAQIRPNGQLDLLARSMGRRFSLAKRF